METGNKQHIKTGLRGLEVSIHLTGEKSVCLPGYLIIGKGEVHLSKLISPNQVKDWHTSL